MACKTVLIWSKQWNTVPSPTCNRHPPENLVQYYICDSFLAPYNGGSCWGERNAAFVFHFLGHWVNDQFLRPLVHLIILLAPISHSCEWNILTSVSCFTAFLRKFGWFLVNTTFCLQSISQSMVNGRQHPHFWQSTSSFLISPIFF